jgi:hypothetical protein
MRIKKVDSLHTKIKRQLYLAKSTTRTARATESPTIPIKVATPFKRTCTTTTKACQVNKLAQKLATTKNQT